MCKAPKVTEAHKNKQPHLCVIHLTALFLLYPRKKKNYGLPPPWIIKAPHLLYIPCPTDWEVVNLRSTFLWSSWGWSLDRTSYTMAKRPCTVSKCSLVRWMCNRKQRKEVSSGWECWGHLTWFGHGDWREENNWVERCTSMCMEEMRARGRLRKT